MKFYYRTPQRLRFLHPRHLLDLNSPDSVPDDPTSPSGIRTGPTPPPDLPLPPGCPPWIELSPIHTSRYNILSRTFSIACHTPMQPKERHPDQRPGTTTLHLTFLPIDE